MDHEDRGDSRTPGTDFIRAIVARHQEDGTYGARVTGLLDLIAEDASLREPIAPGLPYVWAELAFAAAAEMVVHLEDFLLRRTMLLFKTPDGGHAAARSVAQRLTDALGWDEARVAEELARYDELAAAHMACVRG